ncbi:MAG: hypothetical protein LCI03_16170 [Actinobacteria bacterium]|nr:hypothetical protein [Actinomycetota bacterium]
MSGSGGAAPARGKGTLVTGVVLLVLGILATFLGIAVFGGTAKEIAGTTVSAPKPAPAEFKEQLKASTTYAVYEQTDGAATVKPTDVTVTASDGTKLTVNPPASSVVANGEGGKYTEVATFTIGTSGEFTIKVATADTTVAVAPSLSVESQGFAWGAAAIVGVLLGLVGLILIIVGAVQRSRS